MDENSLEIFADENANSDNTAYVVANGTDIGKRLDIFVSECVSLTRSSAQKLIDGGFVSVNGIAKNKNYRIAAEDNVDIILPKPTPLDTPAENIPLDIIYEDSDIIIVNKSKGMVVHPAAGNYTGTLVNALLYHCGGSLSGIGGVIRPGIVHRIDKDTSGLLAVAKNDAAHLSLAEQIKSHSMERCYETIVCGNIKDDSGTINAPIGRHPSDRKKMAVVSGGREAVTHYTVLRHFSGQGNKGAFTQLACQLETGRTHQIRVHMAHIGHPVLGDVIYGYDSKFEAANANLLCGQCLHAKTLTIIHPATGNVMHFESPLPHYFTEIMRKIENQ